MCRRYISIIKYYLMFLEFDPNEDTHIFEKLTIVEEEPIISWENYPYFSKLIISSNKLYNFLAMISQ